MKKNKIIVAGNILVDHLYPIAGWPDRGQLTTILDGIGRSVGGAVCNVGIDLKRLMPDTEVAALGLVGNDEGGEFALTAMANEGIDVSLVGREGITSFTAVMSDTVSRERTFFQYRGANALFSEDSFSWDAVDCDILHVAYILLLDALDAEDAEYGTKLARLLCHAKERGIRTSVDVVSETGERFSRIVPPALRYTDFCVINEIEAGRTTGIELRAPDGSLRTENIVPCLRALFGLGVGEWAVIHCPEGGFGMDRAGRFASYGQIPTPEGYIRGKVGAGDAFCAGVLAAAHRGMTLEEALKLGNAAATVSLNAPGATEAMRTAEECLAVTDSFGAPVTPAIPGEAAV
ncbi:MAG: carbohydrate kinase family protein [Clostridia bacterium]|nr:carbohydrate kinase family protein [Clostridia bacterium]